MPRRTARTVPPEQLSLVPHDGAALSYTVVRSRRRTIGLEVRPDGSLWVRSPLRASPGELARIVREKGDWIRRKQAEFAAVEKRQPRRRFVTGEPLDYLGQRLYLFVEIDPERRRAHVVREDGWLRVALPEALRGDARRERVGDLVAAWLKRRAQAHLPQRIERFAPLVGAWPATVRYGAPRTRWGSCNQRARSLNFNWQIMLAPPALVDYVVVHELCHLRVPDHSPRYWRLVERVMPDYAARRDALRRDGARFTLS